MRYALPFRCFPTHLHCQREAPAEVSRKFRVSAQDAAHGLIVRGCEMWLLFGGARLHSILNLYLLQPQSNREVQCLADT